MTPKELIVVGGPNGSGKTTFADNYSQRHSYPYIAADAIAADLSPLNPSQAQLAASREFLRRMDAALQGEESVVVESTLSGLTFQQLIKKAKANAFRVKFTYLFLDTSESCIQRVRERVLKGGHHVPEIDIRRRFCRSIQNFWNLYRPLSDYWCLIYNAESAPKVVADGTSSRITVEDAELYTQFEELREQC